MANLLVIASFEMLHRMKLKKCHKI